MAKVIQKRDQSNIYVIYLKIIFKILKANKRRLKYFLERRTTSHWPYKINVNSLQPQTYGDNSKLIDYTKLPKINLEDEPYYDDIKNLL